MLKLKKKSNFNTIILLKIKKNLKIFLKIGYIDKYIKNIILKYNIIIILQKYGIFISKNLKKFLLINLK